MRRGRPPAAVRVAVRFAVLSAVLVLGLAATPAQAAAPDDTPRAVRDDAGALVALPRPAQRIVSLSPGITELLFTAGAGARIVATSEHADYPEAARRLPRVSRAQGIDLERIAALRPDLIVTWGSGYSAALLDALRRLGVPIYVHEPRSLEAIASSVERLGTLAGTNAAPAAAAFRARLAQLRLRYGARPPVTVFYQVWGNPLMTLSGRHVASEVLRTCGARNVFDDLEPLVATVDIEAVLARRPQLILAAEPGGADRGALERWRNYPQLPAVAGGHLLTLDADLLDRGSVRILDAAAVLCAAVEAVRAGR